MLVCYSFSPEKAKRHYADPPVPCVYATFSADDLTQDHYSFQFKILRNFYVKHVIFIALGKEIKGTSHMGKTKIKGKNNT